MEYGTISIKLKTLIIVNDENDADLIIKQLYSNEIIPEPNKVIIGNAVQETVFTESWGIVIVDGFFFASDNTGVVNGLTQQSLKTLLIVIADTLSDEQKINFLALGFTECLLKTDLNRLSAIIKREVLFQKARIIGWRKRIEIESLQERKNYISNENQNQLLHKESILREVFDSVDEGFLVLDMGGRIIETNDAYCEMSGYKIEELKQLSVKEIDVEDDNVFVEWRIQQTIANGAERFETRHKRKDGSIFHVEVSATHIPEDDGRIICFCRDITERKKKEIELKERLSRLIGTENPEDEIKFEDLFDIDMIQQMQDKFAEATGVASLITRPDGVPITKPSNFCRLCRDIIRKSEKGLANCYRSDAEIGKLNLNGPNVQPCKSGGFWDAGTGIAVDGRHIANWLIGQVRDETQSDDKIRAYAREIGVDEEESVEALHEVRSMSREQFETVAHAHYIIANQISTIAYQNLQQARFIDEQHKVKQALLESEARYKVFFDSGPDAVVLIDPETDEFVEFNERAYQLLGYTREELKELNIYKIDADEAHEKIKAHAESISAAGYDEFDTKLRTKLGDVRTVHVIVQAVKAGEKQYYLSIFRDITERKIAEKKIAEYQEHLEDLVEQRTADLTAINNELEAFSYSVSHDLRAPLRSINGFSQMLAADYGNTLDETGKHYLERIQSASIKMGQLIENLLNLSHITSREIVYMDVNLSALVKKIITELCAQTPERTIEISIKPGITVRADYNLIKIAMENLLINAHKFTENEEIARIGFDVIKENGKRIYCITDNGAGFDMEYREKLFVPFQRLHSATEYSGSGIGLSIVKRIISRHNGKIWAEAEVGKGATFYFTLAAKDKTDRVL